MPEIIPPEVPPQEAPPAQADGTADTAPPATIEPPTTPPADEFDESLIDQDVANYKPEPPAQNDDDDIDADDAARIEKIIAKKYGGDVEGIKKQMAIDSFFNVHPEYGKYKGAAQKYLNHPIYAGLPIQNIVAIVSSKDQQKIGAQKEREAQRKVAETATPGASVRPTTGGTTDWSKVPKAEFEAHKAKVLGRQGL